MCLGAQSQQRNSYSEIRVETPTPTTYFRHFRSFAPSPEPEPAPAQVQFLDFDHLPHLKTPVDFTPDLAQIQHFNASHVTPQQHVPAQLAPQTLSNTSFNQTAFQLQSHYVDPQLKIHPSTLLPRLNTNLPFSSAPSHRSFPSAPTPPSLHSPTPSLPFELRADYSPHSSDPPSPFTPEPSNSPPPVFKAPEYTSLYTKKSYISHISPKTVPVNPATPTSPSSPTCNTPAYPYVYHDNSYYLYAQDGFKVVPAPTFRKLRPKYPLYIIVPEKGTCGTPMSSWGGRELSGYYGCSEKEVPLVQRVAAESPKGKKRKRDSDSSIGYDAKKRRVEEEFIGRDGELYVVKWVPRMIKGGSPVRKIVRKDLEKAGKAGKARKKVLGLISDGEFDEDVIVVDASKWLVRNGGMKRSVAHGGMF
ncbi:hypothetical protein BJ508DRAFT_303888 [Ascobolus immersus RN42]|uniref:Uncharacterized protein n=1 Tax=Ascobolus immersus RN42 TaxID=1160509 RepID=A0A3N4IFN8_ASCIM|nr:hypothetical protein BJ508DRAFT_303888 [Ascobolus immersus RN42]